MKEAVLRHGTSEQQADADLASRWLGDFENALRRRDVERLSGLFLSDSHWRDLLAFTWSYTPTEGRRPIAERLVAAQGAIQARGFALALRRTPPRRVMRVGMEVVEAIFSFETAVGLGHGVLRLQLGEPDKAWALMTALEEFKDQEEPVGERRPSGAAVSREFGGDNWADRRAKEQAFADREPAVLIIGAGQAGLTTAARLGLLGVDTLCVDTLPRVGDAWRRRYRALALHNQVPINHLPYLPFPPNWPKYLSKDMVADWVETFASAMQCNVWTGTSLVSADRDEAGAHWHARVRRADGTERTLRPRHLVFANGVAGDPSSPKLPGLDDFGGEVMHTHDYQDGSAWKDKDALVVGVGNSGHDVAQDLHSYGARVTMVQRGSIMVVSVNSALLNGSVYYDEKLPTEDCDLIAATNTPTLLKRGYQMMTKRQMGLDKELLDGLAARGMKLDDGPDGAGYQMKTRDKHGGYYLNCGCSELIVDGKIGLLQFEDIDRFTADGARMKDGSVKKAALIVMATGYQNQQEVVRALLGNVMAEKVGPVWGVDADGELRNMFRPTPQKGLWFIGGGLAHARINSRYLALQIKAREAGIVED